MQCLSHYSSTSLEDVAEASSGNIRICQAYYMRDEELNKDLFERIEKAGYKAIALTADSAATGNRERGL